MAPSSAGRSTAAIDKAVFGLQGGPLDHVVAAKAVAFREASHPSFREYATQVVANAAALAEALVAEGFRLVSGGTDNHLLLVDLRSLDEELTGKGAQEALDTAGIAVNKNTIPDDPFRSSPGLRLGTLAVTTTGMTETHMAEIAHLLAQPSSADRIRVSSPPSATMSRPSAPTSLPTPTSPAHQPTRASDHKEWRQRAHRRRSGDPRRHNVDAEIFRALGRTDRCVPHRFRWRWEAGKTEQAALLRRPGTRGDGTTGLSWPPPSSSYPNAWLTD